MKKLFCILISAAMLFTLCACGVGKVELPPLPTVTPAEPPESAEATRAFPVSDEDTKELPLIADRFAGRYWDGHADEAPERHPAR